MRLNRFILDFKEDLDEIQITDLELLKQFNKVLRLSPGEKIIVSNGEGLEFEATIISTDKSKILVSLDKKLKIKQPKKTVNLYLAILKKENFELAIQKSVECGVSNIFPVLTERTVKTGINLERLRKIIKEASEQSGRSIIPKIHEALSLTQALKEGLGAEELILFHLGKSKYQPNPSAKTASIFIGPEGGFSEEEVKLAENLGYDIASLGDFTLRGETAAVIATYLTVN